MWQLKEPFVQLPQYWHTLTNTTWRRIQRVLHLQALHTVRTLQNWAMMQPIGTCKSARQLQSTASTPQQLQSRQLHGTLQDAAHRDDKSGLVRSAVSTSSRGMVSHPGVPSIQHDDGLQLKPHTEWGKMMAQSVAQLQIYSDSPHTFKVCTILSLSSSACVKLFSAESDPRTVRQSTLLQIKGVSAIDDHTGEHRQRIIVNVKKHGSNFSGSGHPVLFVKQPDNPVDPNAVVVMSGMVCALPSP